jgi:hypothetical protein
MQALMQLKKREFCTFLLFFFSRHFTKSMEPSIMRVFESVSDAFERNASFSFLSHSLSLFFFSKGYWTIVTRPDQLTESKNQNVAGRGALRPVEVVVPLPSHSVQQHQSS